MQHSRLSVVLLAGIIVLILVSVPVRQGILPGFEGPNSGVEGFEFNNIFTSIKENAPAPYRWVSQDPKGAILEGCAFFITKTCSQVRSEVQTPQQIIDIFTTGKKVHYWIKASDSLFYEVDGQVNQYTMALTVSAINPGGLFFGVWQGERLWFAVTPIVWNQALQKVGADFGQAWEAPLAIVIEKYNIQQPGVHFKLDPSEQGRSITLYSTPKQLGAISDLGLIQGSDINSTFVGDRSPDSRLRQTGFFPITLTDFGCTQRLIASDCPVATYRLKLYTIQLGKYTYTNPDNTPWGQRRPEGEDPVKPIRDWVSKPLNILGLVGFSTILFFGLAAIVLFWFVGPPRRLRGA